jgi:hypothetical protein
MIIIIGIRYVERTRYDRYYHRIRALKLWFLLQVHDPVTF